ncbi:hypothetical protein ABMA27_012877 [Loxostege sticticalis]|uniref:C2H2-type domain-containing protein n=1 Tax=Loxostege sticticalis TaxID=481309 RepID=A0ABR3H042_LOXSC
MNALRNKGKFQKIFSTENVNLHASGDSAAAGRCCRLCGGDSSLRSLADTYVWDGVEERYDELLFQCFGVRVTSDCLICEWCVRQLRNTERFKALVHAAFNKPTDSPIPSSIMIPPKAQNDSLDSENIGIIDNKVIIEMLKTKMSTEKIQKRKRTVKPIEIKRTTVQCKFCNQKYIMIMPTDRCQDFVCSRCKKNNERLSISRNRHCKKSNMAVPTGMAREQVGLHLKTDLRGKLRPPSLTKKPSQTKRQENTTRTKIAKFKCSVCPKRYTTSEHLVEHIKFVHGECRSNVCVLCGMNFRTKNMLDKHIQLHIDQKYYNNSSGSSKAKHPSKMFGFAREKRSI